ncbi:amidohydrolase [Microbulbifer sp. YPW1]|uniref:amidohydrolase n=1 Tax=Microbulbifer sp. YPW1 TaxID=2745199 RepID=UPI001597CA8A|nr:amidohydrolase [Microbulbifer sp. YPW1]QKX18175.1 amidohydrolase family protein [Microbulbifer sp. YPW1]
MSFRARLTTIASTFLLAVPIIAWAQAIRLQGPDPLAKQSSQTVIYTSREFITMDPKKPRAEAVAVKDGRFIAVGTRTEVKKAAGAGARTDTTFADLVVVPGLIDQHVHPLLAALAMVCDVISIEDWNTANGFAPKALDEATYRKRLQKAIAEHNPSSGSTLFTWGYHQAWHGPMSRAILDQMAPTLPVAVWDRSTHIMFFNTAAMKEYEIDAEWVATLPKAAQEQSDLKEGKFWEAGFFEGVMGRITKGLASPEQLDRGLKFAERYFHQQGITALSEPAGPLDKPLQDAINAAFGDDATPFNFFYIPDGRMIAAKYLDKEGGATLIAEHEKMMSWGAGRGKFLPKQTKLLLDGAIFSQLAQMRDGYIDGHHGEWIQAPDLFARAFDVYWDAGYQIHIHVLGDKALDVLLDTLEKAMKRKPRTDHRTTLVHFGYAQPDQIARIARLGAIVSANPSYTTTLADKYAKVGVGKARTERMVPLGDTLRAGIPISLHSDMPMGPASPLYLMWAAVNRTTPPGWTPGPDQRITAAQALEAVTLGAAYSIRQEKEIGSIEVGKKANLTVLGESPLEVEPPRIKDITVWGTMLEGRLQPVGPAPHSSAPESRSTTSTGDED